MRLHDNKLLTVSITYGISFRRVYETKNALTFQIFITITDYVYERTINKNGCESTKTESYEIIAS